MQHGFQNGQWCFKYPYSKQQSEPIPQTAGRILTAGRHLAHISTTTAAVHRFTSFQVPNGLHGALIYRF